jgi:hypothetical protein
MKRELDRLRKDFEAEASKYLDLKLSVYFVYDGAPDERFGSPNYAINLWQYMGCMESPSDAAGIAAAQVTQFGLSGALVTAIAVVEGAETERFRRMASRAGSLLPQAFQDRVASEVIKNVKDPFRVGKPVFSWNQDPLAQWLNLVLVATSTFQPGRFRRATLAVDPFAASLTAFDHFLDVASASRSVTVDASSRTQKRFRVGLSFPGERRDFVRQIAERVRDAVGEVFYDEWFTAELAVPNLDTKLQGIYADDCELIAVFLCEKYNEKEWCGLEWRAIRELIKKRRDEDVMPFRFDDAAVPGIFSIDGYVDLRNRTPDEAAGFIVQRCEHRQDIARSPSEG